MHERRNDAHMGIGPLKDCDGVADVLAAEPIQGAFYHRFSAAARWMMVAPCSLSIAQDGPSVPSASACVRRPADPTLFEW